MSDIKFIRKNGRIIPIRGSSGATVSSKKKYPAIKKAGAGAAALGGIVGVLASRSLNFGIVGTAALTGLAAYNFASLTTAKKAKGESDKHLAARIANSMNSTKSRKKK